MKTILFICYWFPPANVIGALRPYQQIQYFISQGYKVVVICADFPGELNIDIGNVNQLKIFRYNNKFTSFLLPNLKGGTDNLFFRVMKTSIRNFFFPDQFILNKHNILKLADNFIEKEGIPSIIISSALPFSMHTIAFQISKKYQIKWIADHRDLWAQSPYRKRFGFLRKLDGLYEKNILNHASYNIVIGEKMKKELEIILPEKNIAVIRNGSDISDVNNKVKLSTTELIFSYTGILYGGFRDPSALFEAILLDDELTKISKVNFYGSEKEVVFNYKQKYKELNLFFHEKKVKTAIKEIQCHSHFLVIALGNTDFEKSVLTGKFYEYLETGRAIIALCDEDSELAILINTHQVGIATRNPSKILQYIKQNIKQNFPLYRIPEELTRNYQNKLLLNLIEELL